MDGEEHAKGLVDLVTGLKHAVDKNRNLPLFKAQSKVWMIMSKEKSQTSAVGVKAVDDYTLQYTLNKPETFWNSKRLTEFLF